MYGAAKFLIYGGIAMIAAGIVWYVGGRFLHFGKLPGDIVVEKSNLRFYFPIVTCIVLSVIGSLVMYLIRWFQR